MLGSLAEGALFVAAAVLFAYLSVSVYHRIVFGLGLWAWRKGRK